MKDIDFEVPFEKAKELILNSSAIMNKEYVSIIENIFNSRYIDVYENKNKRSGAFSWGTYGTPPYIMMNYKDNLKSLFTLAHELGHSVHSHYSRTSQPFVYSNYAIFIAEVPSTLNEALLMDHLLETPEDKQMKKYLISYKLRDFMSTFFRQAMLAEFELEAHKLDGSGKIIDANAFSEIYGNLLKKYYGPNFQVDELTANDWAKVPHFFTQFYVYQYSTGYAASTSLSKSILDGKEGAVDAFIELLKSGSSDYPIPLLKKAGVDMSSPQPIEDAIAVFSSLLDEFEV